MTKRLVTVIGIIAAVLLARVYLARGGHTPDGQPELVALDDVSTLKALFNQDVSRTRVIISLAPTCPYCLKGASTIGRMLDAQGDRSLSVFVVWQPVQPTDWAKPGTGALSRIADGRARQFWDETQLVAAELQRAFEGRDLQIDCCHYRGLWWDFLAVFPPGVEWGDAPPDPLHVNGTVEDVAPAVEALLKN